MRELTEAVIDLSSPIDVYSEWVDAAGKKSEKVFGGFCGRMGLTSCLADAVAEEARQKEGQARGSAKIFNRRGGESSQRIDEEDDEGGYEGEGVVADDEDYE